MDNRLEVLRNKLDATAIARHSRKETTHEPYDEILKDADVLHHRLYNALLPAKTDEEQRYLKVMAELGARIAGGG